MYLENLVFDALQPQRLGRFWATALDAEQLTDEPDLFEARLTIDDGPNLDLCFQRVPEPPSEELRFHLDLLGGDRQAEIVDRLLGLGARHLDIGQGDVPWVVLGDPEGNPFCVMEERQVYVDTGPIAGLPLDSSDPDRDGRFWSWLTGWTATPVGAAVALRHKADRGPWLFICPEPYPKGEAKNRLHLDLRLESADDPDRIAAQIGKRGGREVQHPEWGELPWRFFLDPSGNEFCLLPARP